MKSKVIDSLTQKLFDLNILKKSVTIYSDKNDVTSHPARLFLVKCVASGFFVGYVPFAQGTFGSLRVPLLYLVIPGTWFVRFPGEISLALLVISLILYFLGVWVSSECETVWGHDPGRVVIDEIAGMFVTLLFMPLTAATVWSGFFLFRVFDVAKPPPVRWSEQLPRGWGVMSDDVVAGIYANIVLRTAIYFFR